MNFLDYFDNYTLKARVQPALLTLFPLFVTVALWMPQLYELFVGLASLAIACGVVLLFSHIAQSRGVKAEKRLISKWGGWPTTIWLRHRNDNLDEHTKARYHSFLEQNVPSWKPPSPEEEASNPAEANKLYITAVHWLRENTRDKKLFPLVAKENISYGFRRNLYGLKPIGLVIVIVCALYSLVRLYLQVDAETPFSEQGLAALVVSLLAGLAWLRVVTEPFVKIAGASYAERLLGVCDAPVQRQNAT